MTPVGAAIRILLLLACCLQAGIAASADRVRLYVTGMEQEAQTRMGHDIARHIARDANIEIDVRNAAGTPESLLRLRESGNLRLAMLQSDAARAYLDATQRGNTDARMMIDMVRIVAPLHEEEIYFVVRADSAMNSLHDLAQARINLGPLHSGSALTAGNLYRLIFDAAIPDAQASFLPAEEALVKLITERSIDAVVIVAARPARLLANMKPEARQFVKLLKFDATHPTAKALLDTYLPATALAADYPNLIDANQPTLAVRILLAAGGYGDRSNTLLKRFAGAWCKNFPRLLNEGQPQWGSVVPTLQALPQQGWIQSHIVARSMQACREGTPPPAELCLQEDRTLGLCE